MTHFKKYPQLFAQIWMGAIHRGSGGFGGLDETIHAESLEKLNAKIHKLTYYSKRGEIYGIDVYKVNICPLDFRYGDGSSSIKCCDHKSNNLKICEIKKCIGYEHLGIWNFKGAGYLCLVWTPNNKK